MDRHDDQGGRNNPLDRFSRRTNAVVEQSLLGLGILMIGVVAAQVFFRYVLNHSLFWSEELARYILVWLTFLGASVAYRRGVHPRIDLFVSRLARAVPGPSMSVPIWLPWPFSVCSSFMARSSPILCGCRYHRPSRFPSGSSCWCCRSAVWS
jgi:hypothetical protein